MFRYVSCVGCGRRQHQLCVQHLDQIWTSGYVCDPCLRRHNKHGRLANAYTADSEQNFILLGCMESLSVYLSYFSGAFCIAWSGL